MSKETGPVSPGDRGHARLPFLTLKPLVRFLLNLSWFLLSRGVILIGVVLAAARLAFPQIHRYHSEIEYWLSTQTGYIVQFEELQTFWRGLSPELNLRGLRFYSSEIDAPPAGQLDSLFLSLDPVLSILRWSPTAARFDIRGLSLHVIRGASGHWFLQSGRGAAPYDAVFRGTAQHDPGFQQIMVSWLLQQQGLHLLDMELFVSDVAHGIDALHLDKIDLRHEYRAGDTDLDVQVSLPPSYGDSLILSAHGQGTELGPDWQGQLLLLWQRPGWPGGPGSMAWQQESGALRLWAQWQAGRLHSARADLGAEGVRISRWDTELDIPEAALRAEAGRSPDDSWAIDVQVDSLRTSARQWQPASFRFTWSGADQPRHRGELSYLDIADGLAALELLPANPAADMLAGYRLEGALEDVRLEWGGPEPVAVEARFSALGLAHQASGLKMREGDGWFRYQDEALTLRCSGPAQFVLPRWLDGERTLDCVDGELHGARRDAAWHWQLEQAQARLDEQHIVSLSGTLVVPDQREDDRAGLSLSVQDLPLARVQDWLPLTLDEDFRQWSAEALLAGEIVQAELSLGGSRNGWRERFQAHIETRDAVVQYHPDWPALEQLNASVRIDGDTTTMEVRGGSIQGAAVQAGSQVLLTDVGAARQAAHITAAFRGEAGQAQRFILDSPLVEQLPNLAELEADGEVSVEVDLLLPFFEEPVREVRGAVQLRDVQLSPDFGPGLQELHGSVRFIDTIVRGDTLRARYRGYPVFVTIAGNPGQPRRFAIEGRLPGRFFSEQLDAWQPGLSKGSGGLDLLTGEGEWRFEARADGGESEIWHVQLSSDLQGLALALPAPLGKQAATRRPVSFRTTLGTGQAGLLLSVNYDELLFAELAIGAPDAADAANSDLDARQLTGLSIGLGEIAPPLQSGELRLRGAVAELDAGGWFALYSSRQTGAAPQRAPKLAIDAALSVAGLQVLGNDFTDVDVHLTKQVDVLAEARCYEEVRRADFAPEGLALVLCGEGLQGLAWTGAETTGETGAETGADEAPAGFEAHVNLQRLHLGGERDRDREAGSINPADLPDARVSIDELFRDEQLLGRLQFAVRKRENGVDIANIRLDGPIVFVDGNGEWLEQDGAQQSRANLLLKSGTLNDMLQTLGYEQTEITRGKTRFALEADWLGGPGDFSLSSLQGALRLDIGRGHIRDVEPAAVGRIFGLLSLGTLWRRMSLDFSDLFGRGLAFDNIAGDFALSAGLARIRQLQLQGPAANISITGSIDLEYGNYDQRATVTPQASESLPLASALLGPVGIGVGAVYYLDRRYTRVLPDPLGGILQARYRITGPWNAPEVTRLETSSSNQGKDADEGRAPAQGLP